MRRRLRNRCCSWAAHSASRAMVLNSPWGMRSRLTLASTDVVYEERSHFFSRKKIYRFPEGRARWLAA